MIVIDPSAMVEALVGRTPHDDLLDALGGPLSAPHLLDVEVVSVLRGLLLGGKITQETADEARLDHFAFTIVRHELEPLVERVWTLRHQFTTYDASYLALAEALECPLYTCDSKLAVPGHRADVRLLLRTH
ncbi:twitching motility protein PilT [Cellulomonas sp. Leaf334]|nr:twitching motility protein PilT [Cellulomonas sp. Leaf334]